MLRLEEYVSAGGRLLRCGYTTGTCAAAAACAAAELLLAGRAPHTVVVRTPAGLDVPVEVEQAEAGAGWARCAVRKDAGDDPDVTDGVLVHATVTLEEATGVRIEGGVGVGRVTRAGLDQPPGAAAINSVPRAMIREAVQEVARAHGYAGGLAVEVSIPAGVELAARTFNPRLGIEGGISVLGTTGIVRPMSEDALVRAMQLELRVLREAGAEHVLAVPGNMGLAFATKVLGLPGGQAVTCSNHVGAVVDEAARLGFLSLLLVGHLGKLAKVAAGTMNTHSRVADGRLEVMAAHAALAGADRELVARIMGAPTTDAAVALLDGAGILAPVMETVMARMGEHLGRRAAMAMRAGRDAGEGAAMRVGAVAFSGARGLLGMTPHADELLALVAADAARGDVGPGSGRRAGAGTDGRQGS